MAQVGQHFLNLLVGGIAILEHHTVELQRQSGQRVVGVYGDAIVFYLDDACHETLLLLIHEGDDGAGEDVVVVELVVDHEHFTLHLVYAFLVVFTESLCGSQGEVEFLSLLKCQDVLFEGIERVAEASDELERTALLGLLNQMFAAILIDGIELIADGNKLVLCHFVAC